MLISLNGIKLLSRVSQIILLLMLILGSTALINQKVMLFLAMNTDMNYDLYRFVTYGFLGGNLFHLLGNCIGFYYIIRLLEPKIGWKCNAFMILLLMVTSGYTYYVLMSNSTTLGVGGSPAAYGLIAILCVYYSKYKIDLQKEQNSIIFRAIIIYFVLGNILTGISGIIIHLVGFLFGILFGIVIIYGFKNKKMEAV